MERRVCNTLGPCDPAWHARGSDARDTRNCALVGWLAIEDAHHVVCLGPGLCVRRRVEVRGCLHGCLVVLLCTTGACDLGFLVSLECTGGSLPRVVVGGLLPDGIVAGVRHVPLCCDVLAIVEESSAAHLELRERLGADLNPGALGAVVCCQTGGMAVLANIHAVDQALSVALAIGDLLLGSSSQVAARGVLLALLEECVDALLSFGMSLLRGV